MTSLLLVNGILVNEEQTRSDDILIRNGRIERIGTGTVPAGTKTRDLAGLHVLPGIIDDQVHFREPGQPDKADLASESKAALVGGVTSFLDMPNNAPPCVDREGLKAKRARASGRCYANYGFYLGATNSNLEEIRAATPDDACAIKVFMGASTGDMLVDDENILEGIFAEAQLLVVTHCEDTPTILRNEAAAREKYGDDVPVALHPEIRSAEACLKSSTLAVDLARRHGTRLHVLHLTTADEMVLFDRGPMSEKQITAEVCVHHLWFEAGDYERLGTLIKCNPAIKTETDRAALRAALADDRIDIIATDHAPHTRAEKAGHYFSAPSGLPLVQHMVPMMLDLHAQGVLTLEMIVRKAAHNPALRYGIRDRGFVREGYHADLTIVDPAGETEVTAENVLYRCGWSPLEGSTLRGAVAMTVVGGSIAHERGRVLTPPAGQALEFVRNAK